MKEKILLWLDDCRNPFEDDWLKFSPISLDNSKVIWVKSYDEFVLYIKLQGLPDAICFDHDLSDEHYDKSMYNNDGSYYRLYDKFKEKTGYDCAKFLIEYCMENKLKIPLYNIQSANPVGRKNIEQLLRNYIYKFEE